MNKKLKQALQDYNHPIPELNGNSCPDCGKGLFDSKPKFIKPMYPPLKETHCSVCDYTGSRVVEY